MRSEVLIVGGGVIGLSIARELHTRGVRSISVVDRGRLGREASWAAAGMLAPNVEVDSDDLFHRLCAESHDLYPEFCRGLLEETGIDPELDTSGTLFVAFTDADVEELDQRYRRLDKKTSAVERLSASSISELEPFVSDKVREGLLFPNDWQVENRKLLSALQRSAELNGIRLVENAEVIELLTDGSRVTGARTSNQDLPASAVVLATGAWTSFIKLGDTSVPVEVKPIRGQMLCFDATRRRLSRVIFSQRGYVTPRTDGRVLVGATVEDAGFDKAVTEGATEMLVAAGLEIAPGLEEFPIKETWTGLRPFAADGLPVMGEIPGSENLFVATAHYRNGILLAPKTAEIMADRIADGVDSEFFSSFGSERFTRKMATSPLV